MLFAMRWILNPEVNIDSKIQKGDPSKFCKCFSRDLSKGHVGIDLEFLEIINSLYQEGDKMSEVMIKN